MGNFPESRIELTSLNNRLIVNKVSHRADMRPKADPQIYVYESRASENFEKRSIIDVF